MLKIDDEKYISQEEFKEAVSVRISDMTEDGAITEDDLDLVIDQLAKLDAYLFPKRPRTYMKKK